MVFVICCGRLFAWGEDIQSIQADFEQYIYNEDGANVYYKGKILGKSPNKVKWDYQMPFKKEIYMNDNKVAIYEPSLEQVSLSTLNSKSDFISIIKSAKKYEDGTYRTAVDGIEYTLVVDRENKPKSIYFVDTMGTKSELVLSNVKLNVKIDDAVFVFVAPSDVEVLELKAR